MSIHINPYTPWASLARSLAYLLSGRLHLHPEQCGRVFVDEQGRRWRVFRCLTVDPAAGQPVVPGAVFIPRFHVAHMSVRVNILFSWLPIPLYIGLPGFRSKRWMVDDRTGDFAGYYEWDTPEAADRYAHSFAARFMTSRSVPGSVSFQIYAKADAPALPQSG